MSVFREQEHHKQSIAVAVSKIFRTLLFFATVRDNSEYSLATTNYVIKNPGTAPKFRAGTGRARHSKRDTFV